ncbi:hypothetical protein HHL28_06050 [Aerophototrophica crusticola]|uniref:Uncharacterized protein n=1 Tax=Aerophototrophica crusticola TaxID=1709002 RepID=A0A858R6A2_9PROT|nr:hypothetical protein HHL28_06050 [Rhodospirillaceae bacterium B3]
MRSPVLGVVGAIIAIIGLFLAAGTHEDGLLFGGLLFFLFGVLLNFWLIARVDYSDKHAKTEDQGHAVAAE